MSTINNGTALNFGLASTGFSGTGIGTGMVQAADHSKKRKRVVIPDDSGVSVSSIHYDPSEEATLTYFVKGTGLADAITQSTLPDIGTFCTISACPQYPALVKTTWEVLDATMKATNTNVKEVTLKLEFHASITAVAGA